MCVGYPNVTFELNCCFGNHKRRNNDKIHKTKIGLTSLWLFARRRIGFLPNSTCASVRNVVWCRAASVGWINVCMSVGHPPRDLLNDCVVEWLCWPSSAAPSFDTSALPHCLSPFLDCFGQNFPQVSLDMTTTLTSRLPPASALRPNSSLLASFFVGSGLCFLRLAGNDSAGGSSLPSVASSFFRHVQSFHTS